MKEVEERKFLHDIASPVGTAIFVMDMLLEGMKDRPDANSEELTQAKQIADLLENVKTMIEARRAVLIAQGVPSSKTGK